VASGFPDSIASLVAGGATTGATLSGLTFPGSGAGRSTLIAAGGAGEEDADGELDNSPALAASGFGGATTGAMLFGSGFSVSGSGTGGGAAATGRNGCGSLGLHAEPARLRSLREPGRGGGTSLATDIDGPL
jgi:hypothetical protein